MRCVHIDSQRRHAMSTNAIKIDHILCPTDLSMRSQLTLHFASGLASQLKAKLTACHFSPTVWLAAGYGLGGKRNEIEQQMAQTITAGRNGSAPRYAASVFENSVDTARDILDITKETAADLIVMKSRKGVASALHYGSMVERITRGSAVPVLLLPTNFLDSHTEEKNLNFRQVLFDYDFSEATDQLFPFAMVLTEGFNANLHLLTVLEPPHAGALKEVRSRDLLQNATKQRLEHLAESELNLSLNSTAAVEWGKHAETVLKYAENNEIDLICTTLPPAYFYYEKLYCAYLGQLLQSAKCPILALRSV